MYTIKASTALTVPFFVHDAAGDAVTGLTNASFTKRISKNGGAFGAMTVVITEMENGWYSIPLSATHSDTNGLLSVVFTNAGAKQVNLQWRVEARILDDLAYPTTSGRSIDVEATGEVGINLDNTVGALGTAQFDADFLTNALLADNVIAAEQIAAGAITSSEAPNLDAAISSRAVAGDAMALTAGGVDDIWDEVLTGATHAVVDSSGRRIRDLQEFGVYEGGAVWIDTINGTPGTTDFESGTAFNPVNTLADANTLATSLGLTRFKMAPGSSIAFIAAQQGQEFHGMGWTLALGGQDIANTTIIGARVSGIGTGVGAQNFIDCFMGAVTLPDNTEVITCAILGTQTLPAGDIFYARCHSAIAGLVAPLFDFGAAVANTNLSIRNYSGGVDLRNMGQLGVDATSIEGRGQVIVNANCTGGTIVVRGPFTLTDAGAATITQDARSPDNWGLTGIEADGHVHGDLKEWLGAAPNALIAGAVDADVSVIQAGAITAAVIATNAVDADALALDAGQEIADRVLSRSLAIGADGGRNVQSALRALRNRRVVAAGVLTVYEEDDLTPDWTGAVTTTAGNPISEIDPA